MRELTLNELNHVSGGFNLGSMMSSTAVQGTLVNMATYHGTSLIFTGELGTVRGTITAGVIGAGAAKLGSAAQTIANGDKAAERIWQANTGFGKLIANSVNGAIDRHNRNLEDAMNF